MVYLVTNKMRKFIIKNWDKDSGGFSIIETIASIFVFSIVALTVSAILAGAMKIERRIFSAQVVQENIISVFEAMAKEIRVSNISNQDTNCSVQPLPTSLTINHPIDGTVTYRLNAQGVIERVIGSVVYTMSSDDVKFNNLAFCVIGSALPADDESVRVTISASVSNSTGLEPFTVNTQTTVVSRDIANEIQN